MVPFENAFIRFKTPEDSLSYSLGSRQILKGIVNENDAIVFYSPGKNTLNMMYNHKDNRGWEVESPIVDEKIVIFNGLPIKYKKLDDGKYFICSYYFISNEAPVKIDSITDNQNSSFEKFELNLQNGREIAFYYSFVQTDIENYKIIINGNSMKLVMF